MILEMKLPKNDHRPKKKKEEKKYHIPYPRKERSPIFDRLLQTLSNILPLPSQHSLFVRTPQLGQRFSKRSPTFHLFDEKEKNDSKDPRLDPRTRASQIRDHEPCHASQ